MIKYKGYAATDFKELNIGDLFYFSIYDGNEEEIVMLTFYKCNENEGMWIEKVGEVYMNVQKHSFKMLSHMPVEVFIKI